MPVKYPNLQDLKICVESYGKREAADVIILLPDLEIFLHYPDGHNVATSDAKAFDCVDHKILWKILKEMGIPDHLTCLLRNLYACQEATVRTGHGTTDWFQIGKGVHQGFILSPC